MLIPEPSFFRETGPDHHVGITTGVQTRTETLGRACAVTIVLVLSLAACGGYDAPTVYEPITDPAQLYTALALDHRAINLSTAPGYRTIQLTATPRNVLGEQLAGLPAPTFRSTQPLRVRVSHDGLIEALQTGTGILVIAELAIEGSNIRHADTARVNVTSNAAPPVLDRLELDPVTPDSAVWGLNPSLVSGFYFAILKIAGADPSQRLTARAVDAAGNAITGLAIELGSLDPSVGRWINDPDCAGGCVEAYRPGQARMVANTFAYGVAKADTVTFTVKLPAFQYVLLHPTTRTEGAIQPREVNVQRNGWVFWQNRSGQLADVVFDDPTNVVEPTTVCAATATAMQLSGITEPAPPCGAGNIPAFNDATQFSNILNFRVRQFPVPGVYTYRNTVTGAIGRVVVIDG